jgi:hypothetical protein
MSISQNFPATKPSLNLDFARSKRLDPRIFFIRSTTGTYVDEDGLIKTAKASIPRFDHNPSTGESLGLLIENRRTNLMPYSEDLSNWQLYESTVSTNTVIAPDGTLTADKLQETTATDQHLWFRDIGTVGLGSKYTFSCFFKAAERTKISLVAHAQGYTVFDLSNGTVTSGGHSNETIVPYPNGWYRCSITVTKTDTVGAFYIVGWTTSNVYEGTTGYGVYAWGGQLENADYVSSYIPNLSTGTTTRNEEYVLVRGTNFSDFYNANEGTFFVTVKKDAFGSTGLYPGIFSAETDLNNCINMVYIDPSIDDILFEAYVSGANQFQIGGGATIPGKQYKAVATYKLNDIAFCQNGATVQTDSSSSIPTVNQLVIGGLRGGDFVSHALNGTISKLTYYPVRLTNSQLQQLTK